MAPVLGLIALLASRRKQRSENAAAMPDPVEDAEDEVPEMPPEKAARFYGAQARAFRTRGRIALFLCAVLVYITYARSSALPLAGALGESISACALMCLIIQFAVMLTALDVFTAGVTNALHGEISAETLVSLSCIASAFDAVIIAATGKETLGLPFCAVSSLSLLFALWGSRLECSGLRISFYTAARARAPYAVSAEREVYEGDDALMKFRVPVSGFVRRAEEPDLCENAYLSFAPILAVAALLLAVVASAKAGASCFFHIFSALTSVCASLSAFVCFTLPFCIAAKKLFRSGAALAGWPGCRDVGKTKRVVVTDSDIFPAGTLNIDSIRIVEGFFIDTVIGRTGSLLAASGCALAASFTDLMRRGGYAMQPVSDFTCHEGGGFSAFVRGEQVYVGSAGFMQLMGVRLPREVNTKTALFTAVNGSLAGFFNISYTPAASVQDALVSLLRGSKAPVFAIRDVNITPLLIKQRFKIPAEGLDFPAFADRYEISARKPGEELSPAALLSREGLAPLVEAAELGARLYRAVRLGTLLSLLGSALGLLVMFFLCWAGSFDAASAGNAVSFMLLWFVPVLALTFWLTK